MSSPVGIVRELWRYPVKSFRGERLGELEIEGRGVVGDRAFAVRDAGGKLGSGKTTRRFRLLRGLFDFGATTDGGRVLVDGPEGASFEVGDAALDRLLSERYGEPLAVLPEETISHLDAGPVHLISTATLHWVGAVSATAGDVRRFRPNIVVEVRGAPRTEESWLGAELQVGSCLLRARVPTERCAMVGFAQGDLAGDPSVLRFVVERNRSLLGIYASVARAGTIHVGDEISLVRPDLTDAVARAF